MKLNGKGIRLAQANAPIRKELGKSGKIWFEVSGDSLDELAEKYPKSYLGILQTWREALYNQTLYSVDGNTVYVAGVYVDGQTPTFLFFHCYAEDGAIFILGAANRQAMATDWKFVKKDSRRLSK